MPHRFPHRCESMLVLVSTSTYCTISSIVAVTIVANTSDCLWGSLMSRTVLWMADAEWIQKPHSINWSKSQLCQICLL